MNNSFSYRITNSYSEISLLYPKHKSFRISKQIKEQQIPVIINSLDYKICAVTDTKYIYVLTIQSCKNWFTHLRLRNILSSLQFKS